MSMCFCDACDEDSESLIDQAEDIVRNAVEGCREFRRSFRAPELEPLDGGLWLEEGYESATGSSRHANADVRGELFEREWRAWRPREGAVE